MQRFSDGSFAQWLVSLSLLLAAGCSAQEEQSRDDEAAESSRASASAAGTSETSQSEEPSDDEAASTPEWTGHDRLTGDVVPDHYDLHLSIDPSESTFEGQMIVEATVERSTDTIRMHGEELDFASVRLSRDGEELGADVRPVENGGLVVELEDAVAPGPLTMDFEYEAPLDESPEGLYRVEDDGNWYAFTQLEPLEAREVFPCFDEPRFKVRWDLEATIPSELTVASTTRVDDSRSTEEGVRYSFEKTKALPTYLVGFAVGNFDVVEADEGAMGDVPLRVLTTEGQGDLASYALEQTPELVRNMEEYFGQPFPYRKLDLVAVPNFAAGAMENVGLVTFRESLLLIDPERATIRDRYYARGVMAHEYAHMWFGNQVTLEWWDDLWLNEAFATWMGRRTLAQVAPELEPGIQSVQRRMGVMRRDSLSQSRAIRQPIESGGDVYNAFDGITYRKGAAVLDMFETWLGEAPFRAGVQLYLRRHAHETATTRDLMAALEEGSGEPVEHTMAPFLDQPGVPMVTASYDRKACRAGESPEVEMEQTRYRPLGSELEEGDPWRIPVCLRWGGGDVDGGRRCVLFDGEAGEPRRQTVELDVDGCPAWLHPNADERGYYHWSLEPTARVEQLAETSDALNDRERAAFLGHAEAMFRAGELPASSYLESLRAMAESHQHRSVVEGVVDGLGTVERVAYAGDAPEAFESFARELLIPHYERVGFEPSSKDGPGAELLRPGLVAATANIAGVKEVRQLAKERTRRHLDDPEAVDPEVARMVLKLAAREGDEALWERFRRALDSPPSPSMRSEYLNALGAFEEPELARRSLDLYLTDAVRSQNFWRLMGPVANDRETVDVAWEWMVDNYEALVDKLPEIQAASLPRVGEAFCSEAGRERVKSFFGQEAHRKVGTERNLAQALSTIDQCRALETRVAEDVRNHLSK